MTESGETYVLEVNPNCYLARASEFARAAKKDGIGYEELILGLTRAAAARRVQRIERRIRRHAAEIADKVAGEENSSRSAPADQGRRKEDSQEKPERK